MTWDNTTGQGDRNVTCISSVSALPVTHQLVKAYSHFHRGQGQTLEFEHHMHMDLSCKFPALPRPALTCPALTCWQQTKASLSLMLLPIQYLS